MSLVARAPWRCVASTFPVYPRLQRFYSNSHETSSSREKLLRDEYATIRPHYDVPKHPIVLAHGLLGFDEFQIGGVSIPFIRYWRGIVEELAKRGVEVITTSVPPSGSIEARAMKLGERIAERAAGRSVNIIAGLDSRYMITNLRPVDVDVKSLTTVASPHRGSAFADYMIEQIGSTNLPRIYSVLESLNLETEAFSQLTRKYIQEEFNPRTPDVDGIRYYSYGASIDPAWYSSFRIPHDIIERLEQSPNDGLVSVRSSKWGDYKGTLTGVNHLDVINWTNWNSRFRELVGWPKQFNAIAFYLDISDMLAKEGL